jgi:hypothetical protein
MIGFIGTSPIAITINYNSSQLMVKIRSIPYRTTSAFSSIATDLVLIYESITSSASFVRWETLHSRTLNYCYELINEFTYGLSSISRGELKTDHHLEFFVYYYLFHKLLRNVSLEKHFLPMTYFGSILCHRNVLTGPLSSIDQIPSLYEARTFIRYD